jgi:hypothetical protein
MVDQKRPVDVQNGANDPELPPARQPEADAGQPIKFVGVQRALRRAIRVARSSALQSLGSAAWVNKARSSSVSRLITLQTLSPSDRSIAPQWQLPLCFIRFLQVWRSVNGDASHYERNAGDILQGWKLRENERADDRR